MLREGIRGRPVRDEPRTKVTIPTDPLGGRLDPFGPPEIPMTHAPGCTALTEVYARWSRPA